MLRLLVESDDSSYKAEACSRLLSLLETLQVAREQYSWDLAQLCIDMCAQPIEKLVVANSSLINIDRELRADAADGGGGPSSQGDTAYANGTHPRDAGAAQPIDIDSIPFPLDLDIPWDYLWDDVIDPWPVEFQQDVV